MNGVSPLRCSGVSVGVLVWPGDAELAKLFGSFAEDWPSWL